MIRKTLRNIVLASTVLGLSCAQKEQPKQEYIITRLSGKEQINELKKYVLSPLQKSGIVSKNQFDETGLHRYVQLRSLTDTLIIELGIDINGNEKLILGYNSKEHPGELIVFQDLDADGTHEWRTRTGLEPITIPTQKEKIAYQQDYELQLSNALEFYWFK